MLTKVIDCSPPKRQGKTVVYFTADWCPNCNAPGFEVNVGCVCCKVLHCDCMIAAQEKFKDSAGAHFVVAEYMPEKEDWANGFVPLILHFENGVPPRSLFDHPHPSSLSLRRRLSKSTMSLVKPMPRSLLSLARRRGVDHCQIHQEPKLVQVTDASVFSNSDHHCCGMSTYYNLICFKDIQECRRLD